MSPRTKMQYAQSVGLASAYGPKYLEGASVRRAEDRKRMAEWVAALAEYRGATTLPGEFLGPREQRVDINIGGLRVSVDFDGNSSQPNVFILPWITDGQKLSEAFGLAQRSTVNSFHRQKCTSVAEGFDVLCYLVRIGCVMAADGTAFVTVAKAEGSL